AGFLRDPPSPGGFRGGDPMGPHELPEVPHPPRTRVGTTPPGGGPRPGRRVRDRWVGPPDGPHVPKILVRRNRPGSSIDPDRGREDTTARRANSLPCREWGGTSERTRLQPRLPRRGPLWSGRKGGAAPERQGIPRVGWSSRPRGRSGGLVSEDSGPRRATRRRDGTRLRTPARPVLREIGTRGSRPESGFPSGGIPRPGWRLMVRRRDGRRVEDGSERTG